MRVSADRVFLLLLAGLFLLAILRREDLPGEEVLPELFRGIVHEPLLAPAGAPDEADPQGELDRLRDELDLALHQRRVLRERLAAARALLGLKDELDDGGPHYAPVTARVLSTEPGPYRKVFRITRGHRDGVRVGMPVVDGVVLVGLVETVQKTMAVVRRPDDARCRMEVVLETLEGPFAGVAEGTGDGFLRIRYLRGADAVREGTPVFTTAYDPRVPASLLVGRVEEVEDLNRDEVLEVRVKVMAAGSRPIRVEVLRGRLD
ncbi:MAG: rod shape-determining protein MreC [Planctomycetota bacterium]